MIAKNELDKILSENVLGFWQRRMVDDEQGGFYGRIDGHGQLHPQADKAIILNTRILWTFSAAFQLTRDPLHKQMADRAYRYILDHFMDQEAGGVYWTVDYTGKVVSDKKQVYAQAFAIYAFSEYYKIAPQSQALKHAVTLYNLLETHSLDKKDNGYLEAFDRQWGELSDVRLSDKDMNATKTMNTHLHVLEAYTNLLMVWDDSGLRERLKNLIELMSTRFISASDHFNLFFNNQWELQSHEISFGHDIEGSWLLCEAAEVHGEAALITSTKALAIRMTGASLEGMDEDGGLMNEAGPEGLTDTDKHWWPQAEALVGLVNAWQITADERYLTQADKTWSFIKARLIDPKGEWHWRVTRAGQVILDEDKAGPWKCPYHNGRALLELRKRLS
ncbi:MAG: AGE family epimerase/isomerase [Marinoscillum sp.]